AAAVRAQRPVLLRHAVGAAEGGVCLYRGPATGPPVGLVIPDHYLVGVVGCRVLAEPDVVGRLGAGAAAAAHVLGERGDDGAEARQRIGGVVRPGIDPLRIWVGLHRGRAGGLGIGDNAPATGARGGQRLGGARIGPPHVVQDEGVR